MAAAGRPGDLAEARPADDLPRRARAGEPEDGLRVVEAIDPFILDGVPAGGQRRGGVDFGAVV